MTSVHGSCGKFINTSTVLSKQNTHIEQVLKPDTTLFNQNHLQLAQITSIWYETSQPVALSQGRHRTYTRHSKTPHSVANAVECSRQRPVISTRTERRETAGMQAVAAALQPSATRSECGCNAAWSRISITSDNGRSPFLTR